jgi:hypothetical protein
VTQTYLSPQATTAPFTSREASAAGRLRPNAETGKVDFGICGGDSPLFKRRMIGRDCRVSFLRNAESLMSF